MSVLATDVVAISSWFFAGWLVLAAFGATSPLPRWKHHTETTHRDDDGDGTGRGHRRARTANGCVLDTIGDTPLMRVPSLSTATGCDVYVKCEYLNPGGSVKDRVALRILREALECGALKPGGVVTEGTAGSTGVSLALVAAALGTTTPRATATRRHRFPFHPMSLPQHS